MGSFLEKLAEKLPEWFPQFLEATWQTLQLTAASFAIALAAGILACLLRISHVGPLRWAAIGYIEVGRAVPALVILFLIYFGLQDLIPSLRLSSFTAAAIGLGLQGGAILAEVFRAGIEAVDRGQREASLALGMTPARTMTDVVAPQAIRVVLPPTGNYLVGLLTDTSIASIIAAPELMLRAKDLASSSFLPMHAYVTVAIFYFALSYPLSLAVRRLELRFALPQR
jgi:polar amino acid transport system permease protein